MGRVTVGTGQGDASGASGPLLERRGVAGLAGGLAVTVRASSTHGLHKPQNGEKQVRNGSEAPRAGRGAVCRGKHAVRGAAVMRAGRQAAIAMPEASRRPEGLAALWPYVPVKRGAPERVCGRNRSEERAQVPDSISRQAWPGCWGRCGGFPRRGGGGARSSR